MPTIGFAGLGRMGSRMTASIARGGFPLVIHSCCAKRAARLKAGPVADPSGMDTVALIVPQAKVQK